MPKIHFLNIELIKSIMEERGLNARDLAECTGYSERTIKKYLGGADQSRLTIKLPVKIADALNMPLAQLIYRKKLIIE